MHPNRIHIEEPLARYLPVKEVKAPVTDALQKNMSTEGVKVIGVGTTKMGTSSASSVISPKTPPARMRGWLQDLGSRKKMGSPRFGVVVHRSTHERNRNRGQTTKHQELSRRTIRGVKRCPEGEDAWSQRVHGGISQDVKLLPTVY
ncbi:hypothetical protein BDBG_08655 [Blastomyces gilchristii SLH14081]|uniref:Uncharacterized protein n=1 Tax=Blastomyces gilchristii (strain SLH14081) TaxID=559298 RepID=A0A179V048_BLAGS|nr:uncharacterized protein BDBG_08655 [Blastomyces gilchristii SLH14081]OAT13460.1 hypothetical protein BDBG_08655 [Blastomyces gilchristii SLH14081]